jgi:hypothetical protein
MGEIHIEERGLTLVDLEESHIKPFVDNISPESEREFNVFYNVSLTDALTNVINDPFAFAVLKDGRPVAITGAALFADHALIWAVFSNDLRRNWISFARASRRLMSFYHGFHEELRSTVWSENHMVHQWLLHLGFVPTDISYNPKDKQSCLHFVRCDKDAKYGDGSLSRPVLH